MQLQTRLTRAALLVLLGIVTTASHCPVDPQPAHGPPPKPVRGSWTGELYGVRFNLAVTESGTPNYFINATDLGGSGWLIYGSPADSLPVAIHGSNMSGESGVVIDIQLPGQGDKTYGWYSGSLQTDGSLLGQFERFTNREPSPSPWTGRWPAGPMTAAMSLTRQ